MATHSSILLVLGSSHWGGGERHVQDLARHLVQDFNIGIAAPNDARIFDSLPDGIATHPLKERGYVSRSRELAQIAKNYSLVHAHLNRAAELLFPLGFFHPHCARLATIHGFSSVLPYFGTQRLIAVSQAVANSLPWVLRRRCHVVYNGVPSSSPTQKAGDSPLRLRVFATVHPNKGQKLLCQTLKHYPVNGLECLLLGEGQARHMQDLEKLVASSRQVRWEPFTGNLEPYWETTDAVLIPSYKEALSYVAIEALSRGIPIVAARTGGLKEVLTNPQDGFFFEAGNMESLHHALHQLVQHHRRCQTHLQQEPFLSRRPEFTLQYMLERTRQIYDRLLANGNH